MPYMIRNEWIDAAFSGGTVEAGGETHPFVVHHLGELELPSGRLAASDPLVSPDPEPLAFHVEPGRYSVDLAVSQVGEGDQRVAFARVLFAEGPVSRWSMISTGDQDPSTLGDGEILGYGVDAGTGCFMSPEAGALLRQRMERENMYFEQIIEEMQKTYRHTWSWVHIRPDPEASVGILAFSSGYGDGVYASYLGLDASGRPICLVTDFAVVSDLPLQDVARAVSPPPAGKRPWWRFWS